MSKKEGSNKEGSNNSGQTYDGTRPEDDSTNTNSDSNRTYLQESMLKRTVLFAGLVIFIGAIASAGFMYVGITNARQDNEEKFERRSAELIQKIQSSWQDYETAGLWIHESCRNRNATRQEFRGVYEYLASDGLEFQAAEWIPRISQSERQAYEATSLAYYQEYYPEVLPYVGLRGLEPDPENPGETSMQLRSEQEFYYPVSYVEPVLPNAAAIDFDLYSSASRRATIEAALETYQPTLTRRLRLVQETDPSAYSVLLMHPGIPLSSEGPQAVAKDLSLMVIRIPSLLYRSVRGLADDQKAVYLYDVTEAQHMSEAQFLGAIKTVSHKHNEQEFELLPEVDYTTFTSSFNGPRELIYQDMLNIGSSQWVAAVVALDSEYDSSNVFVIVGGAVLFVATVCLAIWMVQNAKRTLKMERVLEEAEAEKRIVSSLFPSNVRDRLLHDAAGHDITPKTKRESNPAGGVYGTKPIADLFPNVSIMFADLVGFTSWASARDPAQVFTLLETTYHAFDEIAGSLGIFKVETVGDCYVAASGMPEARPDHAEVMAKFATRCLKEMSRIAHELEPVLGPDTGDLNVRCGVHSGQVTAGVLRGLKGRFQLFGDAVNVASRMETTGEKGKCHVSQEFADLLIARGKGDWLTPRTELVNIKGKGMFQTFWLEKEDSQHHVSIQSTVSLSGSEEVVKTPDNERSKDMDRLVTWNVKVMMGFLKNIVAHRQAIGKQTQPYSADMFSADGTTPLDEAKGIIALPAIASNVSSLDANSIELEAAVVSELEQFVEALAQCYNAENPFHGFAHASHVTMSVSKLLGRIVEPRGNVKNDAKAIHDATFGISSDPLTHFACIFAALIHDVDHPGVPNSTLVAENAFMARAYMNKSVAEQNSTDVAWSLFTSEDFRNLRQCVCCDIDEFKRFRKLLVTIVMATDVMDKELNADRRKRWEGVFSEAENVDIPEKELIDRKATIVLEHLMQASDVAHTMQHWNIYVKWNERLFMEMYSAFKAGRLEKDPSTNWYEGEIGFLDFYVIPLAKKLDTCGVFGVSSDEYLNYASTNRKLWSNKGREMVSMYLQKYEEKYGRKVTA